MYGGTKEEMQRLLEDAEKIAGVEFDISSYADVVEAIHVIQTEMGIAGTTAAEAGSTISGSLSSAGAAWSNLLTGIADDNADFEGLVDNFVESVGVAAGNLLPRIETALNGVADLIEELFPVIMDRIPEIMNDVLPNVVDSGVAIVESFVEGLSENQDSLVDTAFDIVMTLINSALDLLPDIVELGINIIGSLADGIIDALPNLIDAAVETIITLSAMLLEPDNVLKLIETALEIINIIVDGLLKALPQLVGAAETIIDRFVDYILTPGNLSDLLSMAVEIIVTIGKGLITSAVKLGEAATRMTFEIIDKFRNADWLDIGKNVVDGILSGLKNGWTKLTGWFSDAWDDLVDGVKDLLDIHSPSKVFAGIGKNMALGVGEGWNKAFDGISDDITSSMDFERSIKVNASGTPSARPASGVNVVQNIYASKMTPSEVMDEAIYYQKKAVLFGV